MVSGMRKISALQRICGLKSVLPSWALPECVQLNPAPDFQLGTAIASHETWRIMEWTRGEFLISDDGSRLDAEAVHALVKTSYWAEDRTLEITEKSMRHSLNFGLFEGTRFIGYARVVTDYSTHGYLADVIIEEPFRKQGLGKWLLECILSHPDLKTTRIDLVTKDAQEFYREYGFGSHRFTFMVRYPD